MKLGFGNSTWAASQVRDLRTRKFKMPPALSRVLAAEVRGNGAPLRGLCRLRSTFDLWEDAWFLLTLLARPAGLFRKMRIWWR
jgi:hypothetical protein